VTLKYKLSELKQLWLMKLVWRLPVAVVYWCAIRVMANATTGEYSNQIVPDLTAMEALERWENKWN